MGLALDLGREAARHGDVPVGCVVVSDGEVIGKSENRVEIDRDATAHAEMLAIRAAQVAVGYKHLLGCDVYVTLEPCAMCAGALVLSRIGKLYIGAEDWKSGACGSVLEVASNARLNHRCEVEYGLLRDESSNLLKEFFKEIRGRDGRRN